MKISLNWLREHVELPSSVDELTHLLTRAGVEVEGVISLGVAIPKVVVAQINESSRHPNADRLSVCKVDDGSGVPRQIVCGAKNYKVGDKVPLALPGAVLPGDFKIKVGKLRGVESEGMLCSAGELGLPVGEDGLLILPGDATVGAPFSELFPGDTVLDLEITPNRPDLLSHIGIAREVAALTGKTFARPDVPVVPHTLGSAVSVESARCPFYTVQAISGVTVGPSPDWLKRKLEAVGLRAINNIVDITNFVMLELGQPLHAFDADKLDGAIRVRDAAQDESFLALDGRTYKLASSDIVIADGQKAVALGGVMGGEDSGVTAGTKNILLESAAFEPSSVRRTSRTLGLLSDSSYRFERGVDRAGVGLASDRAVSLILELAGGAAGELRVGASANHEVGTGASAEKIRETVFVRTLPLRHARVTSLLGVEIPSSEIDSILTGFGLRQSAGGWDIPSFRQDLTREVDLIEEIARVVGMERIPSRLSATPAAPGSADAVYDFQMELRRKLVGQGMSEARTSTLVSEAMLWQDAPAIRLRNPLGEDQAFLRTSLLPGLLGAVERNIRHGAKRIGLYEVGRTFHAEGREETGVLAFVLTGETAAGGTRGERARPLDWHDARGVFEALVPAEIEFRKIEPQAPLALAAEVFVGDTLVGVLGQLAPSSARHLGANAPVLAAELSIEALRALGVKRTYRDIPKFPAVTRDLALVCPFDLPYAEITAALCDANEPLLESVEPFDLFVDPTGARLPADRKSLAISLTFRTSGRTLNGDEVNAACERLKQRLKTKLAVDLRE